MKVIEHIPPPRYIFYIESETGDRIYSPATFDDKKRATDLAFDAAACFAGSYSNLDGSKLKWGVEEVK